MELSSQLEGQYVLTELIYINIYIHIYIYTYTYINVYIYIYTHTPYKRIKWHKKEKKT